MRAMTESREAACTLQESRQTHHICNLSEVKVKGPGQPLKGGHDRLGNNETTVKN